MYYIWFHMGGVFMPEQKRVQELLHITISKSLLNWIAAAAVGLLLAACLVDRGVIPYSSLGYVSSALSFLAALFAGAGAKKGEGNLISVIVCAAALVIVLLTLGFLIGRSDLSSSGILSVVTFTISGFVAGALLFSKRKKGKNQFTKMRRR